VAGLPDGNESGRGLRDVLASSKKAKPDTLLLQIRDRAKQSGLAYKLFTQGAQGMSPTQVTQNLRQILAACGVQIPRDAIIPLDVAQVILSGGVVVNGLEEGLSIAQLSNPAMVAVSALSGLLSDLGIIDKLGGDLIGLGVNAALAVSSCGLNILADIGVILSLISVIGDIVSGALTGSQEKADSEARKNLKALLDGYVSNQYNYAASQVAAFNQGGINYFDAIGNIGRNSPYVFKNFFPELGVYFPDFETVRLTAQGKDSGWFGDKTGSASYELREALIRRAPLQAALVDHFISTPLREYYRDFQNVRTISVRACATLSMIQSLSLKGPAPIPANFNVLNAMMGLGVTPYILGDEWFFVGGAKGQEMGSEPLQFPYIMEGYPVP
jgi:hypothetical protein